MVTLEQYVKLYEKLKHNKGNINDIILREGYLIYEGASHLQHIINYVSNLFTSKHLIHLLKGEKVDEIIVTEIFTKLDEYPKNLRISHPINVSWVYYIALNNPNSWRDDLNLICNCLVRLAKSVEQGKITKQQALIYKDKKFIYDDIIVLMDFLYKFEVKDGPESILIEDKTHIINKGAEVRLNNRNFLVVSIKTQEASDFYGQLAEWCTVTKNMNPSMLNFYLKKGELLVIIDKLQLNTNDDLRCISIHVNNRECVDIPDDGSWYIFDGSEGKYNELNKKFKFTRVFQGITEESFSLQNVDINNTSRFKRNLKTLQFYDSLESLSLASNHIDEKMLYNDIIPYIHKNCIGKITINLRHNPSIANSVLDLKKVKTDDNGLNNMITILGNSRGLDSITITNADKFTNTVKVTDKEMLINILKLFKGDLNIFDVSAIKSMEQLFSGFNSDKRNIDISKWDVSGVTDMNNMFIDSNFKGDISGWDVSNVTSMRQMFFASKFNGNISKWNTSKVTDMAYMFSSSEFNGNISNWKTTNVTDMAYMFSSSYFNGDISKWKTPKVTDMNNMFFDSYFNGDISKWKTPKVTNMSNMFCGSDFNGDISEWNVSKVTDMSNMFGRSKFNGDISNWNVSKVISMDYMFSFSKFNGDISNWNVSKLISMSYMFRYSDFKQDISKWNIGSKVIIKDALKGYPIENLPEWYKKR